MNLKILFLFLILFFSGCIVPKPTVITAETPEQYNFINAVQGSIPIPTAIPAPIETPYPKPDYIPETMRQYNTMQKGDLILPIDPQSYITPGSVWVKWQASQLYIAADGRIKYKYEKTPWVRNVDGTVFSWSERPYYNNYSYELYGSGVDKNNIPWMMPDYYITHGGRGVCTAWAAAVTSMMLSGEMSLQNGSGFTKQIIPAKMVIGYSGGSRDAWTEYKIYNKIFITTTGYSSEGTGEKVSTTTYTEPQNRNTRPVFEVTDKYFKEYTP